MQQIIYQQTDCVYVLPYTSTVSSKFLALSPFAIQMNFLLQMYASNKGNLPPKKCETKHSLYIATIEKASALVTSLLEIGRVKEIGLIVIEDIGNIGAHKRGSLWNN